MPPAITRLLFPPSAIPGLRSERGEVWADLVTRIEKSPADSIEQVAFVLMMARLSACAMCTVHSFRAIRGCVPCAAQAVRRFRGTDDELAEMFAVTQAEVSEYLEKFKIGKGNHVSQSYP